MSIGEDPALRRQNRNRDKSKGGRGGSSGRGRRPGKREFDRHSGTGRGKEIKKQGAGGHNWGKEGEILDDANVGARDDDENANNDGEEVEPEEEVIEFSLDEYNEQLKEKRSGDAFKKLENRSVSSDAIEGKVLKNERNVETNFIMAGGPKEKKNRNRKQGARKGKQLAFEGRIRSENDDGDDRGGYRSGRGGYRGGGRGGRGGRGSFRREGSSDGGRGRGGRRGGRGDRGRGSSRGRGSYNKDAGLNVTDQSAFPALGSA